MVLICISLITNDVDNIHMMTGHVSFSVKFLLMTRALSLHIFLFYQLEVFKLFIIYFWLCWVLVALGAVSRGRSPGAVPLTALVSLAVEPSLQGVRAAVAAVLGSGAQAQELPCTDLVACPGSSQTRDWTHVSCTGRRILYH